MLMLNGGDTEVPLKLSAWLNEKNKNKKETPEKYCNDHTNAVRQNPIQNLIAVLCTVDVV